MGLFNWFTQEIAIDLGTANTLIIHNDEVVVNEPSIVALNRNNPKEVLAVGKRALMMQAEKIAADLGDAHEAVAGTRSPVATLSAAIRRLERRAAHAPSLIDPAVKAMDTALRALDEALRTSTRRASTPLPAPWSICDPWHRVGRRYFSTRHTGNPDLEQVS